MSCGKQSAISQTVQVETALQLGTTVVRCYQYISDLFNDSRKISLTTDDGLATLDDVIQTLGQFGRDISATKLTITGHLLTRELGIIVGDCKKECDSLRNNIQAWLQFVQSGCALRVGLQPSPLLSDIVTKCHRCITDESGSRNIHLEHQQRAIKGLLSNNQYAQTSPRLLDRI